MGILIKTDEEQGESVRRPHPHLVEQLWKGNCWKLVKEFPNV